MSRKGRGGEIMARTCEICGKGLRSGNNVSHSMRHTKRVWKPNLKRVKIVDGSTVRHANVCTRCLRSNKVTRV